MSVPSEQTVFEVLERNNRHDVIANCVFGAWSDYEASTEAGRWRRKGTRANIMWERMVDRAINDFLDDDGVHSIEQDDTIIFVFDQVVALKFKKADNSNLTRNYPTPTAQSYHNHTTTFPGLIGEEQRVEVGYVLSKHETSIETVRIIARQGKSILWWYPIDAEAKAVMPLPLAPTPTQPTAGLVRIKSGRAKKREGEKS